MCMDSTMRTDDEDRGGLLNLPSASSYKAPNIYISTQKVWMFNHFLENQSNDMLIFFFWTNNVISVKVSLTFQHVGVLIYCSLVLWAQFPMDKQLLQDVRVFVWVKNCAKKTSGQQLCPQQFRDLPQSQKCFIHVVYKFRNYLFPFVK